MKTTILLLALILSALAGSVARYMGPPVPNAVSIQAPTEKSIKEGFKHDQRLRTYRRAAVTARETYRRNGCTTAFAEATGRVAVDYGLSPRLLAGLVFVESSCNPNAVSGRDSVGLTQVNPKVWRHTRADLKNPVKNLEIGARILKTYIDKYGLVEGLHHYNGYSETHEHTYVNKVLTSAGIVVI